MSSVNSLLDIAKSALYANQQALDVTAHNIANANTPGYTRQRAVLAPNDTMVLGGNLHFGRGVKVDEIRRIYDGFKDAQIRSTNSSLNRFQTKEEVITILESSMNDLDGYGLSDKLSGFFNSIQDVINKPSSYAERLVLLSNSGLLTDKFNSINTTITKGLEDMRSHMTTRVAEINDLASQVASMNREISSYEVGGSYANDMRDKRDNVLNKLSELVDIHTVEGSLGSVDVYIGGSYLVAGGATSPLELTTNAENPEIYNIVNKGVVLNSRINGGMVKGLLDSGEHYLGSQKKLDLLSASITKAVNLKHRAGYGLDGTTGNDFFKALTVSAADYGTNTGSAGVTSASVSDLSTLSLDDYEVRFTGPAAYTIKNLYSGAITTGAYASGTPITFGGMSVTFSGAPATGDKFLVSASKNAAKEMSVALADPNKFAASTSVAGLPGNNENALSIVGLKESKEVRGATFGAFYSGMVSENGAVLKETSRNLSASDSLLNELQLARDSLSGVSIEEETINLMKLQRSYEAAAKLFTVADQLLESLINLR